MSGTGSVSDAYTLSRSPKPYIHVAGLAFTLITIHPSATEKPVIFSSLSSSASPRSATASPPPAGIETV